MPNRLLFIAIPLLLLWLGATFLRTDPPAAKKSGPQTPQVFSESKEKPPPEGYPGDALLEGYGTPENPPIDDLRKLHSVLGGYFSVIKDVTRHPIGGNQDLAACLLGENINRQAFIRPDHPILNESQLLIDRWGTPFSIHPEAARELTIRSAGPDTRMFSQDDLIILPTGLTP